MQIRVIVFRRGMRSFPALWAPEVASFHGDQWRLQVQHQGLRSHEHWKATAAAVIPRVAEEMTYWNWNWISDNETSDIQGIQPITLAAGPTHSWSTTQINLLREISCNYWCSDFKCCLFWQWREEAMKKPRGAYICAEIIFLQKRNGTNQVHKNSSRVTVDGN